MSEYTSGNSSRENKEVVRIHSCWPAVTALTGIVLCTIAFLAAYGSRDHANGVMTQLGRGLRPIAGVIAIVTLASEVVTLVALIIDVARSRFRAIVNPKWIISALCAVLVAVVILWMYVVAVTRAIAPA